DVAGEDAVLDGQGAGGVLVAEAAARGQAVVSREGAVRDGDGAVAGVADAAALAAGVVAGEGRPRDVQRGALEPDDRGRRLRRRRGAAAAEGDGRRRRVPRA